MAAITLSPAAEHPGIFHSLWHGVSEMFARYRWHRFQIQVAILSDRQLAAIGVDRAAILVADTAEEFLQGK